MDLLVKPLFQWANISPSGGFESLSSQDRRISTRIIQQPPRTTLHTFYFVFNNFLCVGIYWQKLIWGRRQQEYLPGAWGKKYSSKTMRGGQQGLPWHQQDLHFLLSMTHFPHKIHIWGCGRSLERLTGRREVRDVGLGPPVAVGTGCRGYFGDRNWFGWSDLVTKTRVKDDGRTETWGKGSEAKMQDLIAVKIWTPPCLTTSIFVSVTVCQCK